MAERYIGIDLNEKYAMVSYYMQGMSEPDTFSMVTGSEIYQIPVCVAKRRGSGQWLYGEEARKHAKEEGIFCMEGLLKKSLEAEPVELEGTIYDASELLFLFLKKMICLPPQLAGQALPDKLVITAEYMNLEYRKLFGLFAEWLGLPLDQLMLLDYREAFYYYALSQTADLCIHQIALFYYTSKKLLFWRLSHDRRTIPQVAAVEEKSYEAMLKERDEEFANIAKESLAEKYYSAVYLIGDGFEGEWMKKSLGVICRGRRAFMGKNLFCKGACYGAAVKSGKTDWPYIYMGDNELRMNVSLEVTDQGEKKMLSLIDAGDNWYEAGGEWEVILKGSPSVEVTFQSLGSKEAVIRSLELTDLPGREEMVTRLRITVKPAASDRIRFTIRDMGFGEITKASEKVWEYTVAV